MKSLSFMLAAAFLILAQHSEAAHAQAPFKHSLVQFETDERVELEKARLGFGGNVFVFFYRKGHPNMTGADSLFLSDPKISVLLNEQYARFAVDLEGDYAKLLLSRVAIGGPVDKPFVMLLSLEHQTHEAIWSNWGSNAEPWRTRQQLEQMYSWLWSFADHGTTE